jgi:hypothetical protein
LTNPQPQWFSVGGELSGIGVRGGAKRIAMTTTEKFVLREKSKLTGVCGTAAKRKNSYRFNHLRLAEEEELKSNIL